MILVTSRLAVPTLEIVSGKLLEAPTDTSPKAKGVGETSISGCPIPVPDNDTTSGELGLSLLSMLNSLSCGTGATLTGSKVTVILLVPLGTTVKVVSLTLKSG